MDEIECVVIGAGVVGLAIARALALSGREVVVLERELAIGMHGSSRNSEVIHAGIYYPPHSLMARFCVEGRNRLYDYCRTHAVPHRRCGKLLVALDDSEARSVESIAERARRNGVSDIAMIGGAEAQALEPNLKCVSALVSPSTGIVDSHALMLAYQGDAEANGAVIAFATPFSHAVTHGSGFDVLVDGTEPIAIRAKCLVNSAGLFAPAVAQRIVGMPPAQVPKAYYARGVYFSLSGPSPFSRLIYPVPAPGGLGVHLTLDLGGQTRFGPDVEWIDGVDYSVNRDRLPLFVNAIKRYWPEVEATRLHPGYAGIRPKIVPPGASPQDFVVQGRGEHGVRGLVNLFGIESPGLTASLAIADHVLELIEA